MIDSRLIDLSEWAIVHMQDKVHVPKWKLVKVCTALWAMMELATTIPEHDWVNSAGAGVIVLIFGGLFCEEAKEQQKRADRLMMNVASEFKHSKLWVIVRVLGAVGLLLLIVPPYTFNSVNQIFITTAVYALSSDTFPMIDGPTLRERLRNFFTLKAPAPAGSRL